MKKTGLVQAVAQTVKVFSIVALVLGFFYLNYWFASLVLPVLHPHTVFLLALVMTAWGLVNFISRRNRGGE